MGYILIVGAKGDIAKALAKKYASGGYNLYLAAIKSKELKDFAQDLNIRYQVKTQCLDFNILAYHKHATFYASLKKKPEGVISAVGYLGEQKKSEIDFEEMNKIISTNFLGIVNLFNIIAKDFEKRKSGFIVGISSVAGERGRRKNYTYGAAKAALTAYLSGLRNRLFFSSVQVLTVKPGFVKTKMTKNLEGHKRFASNPEKVAADIYKAQQKQKNILYTSWIWRWIMWTVKLIPENKFKKMDL